MQQPLIGQRIAVLEAICLPACEEIIVRVLRLLVVEITWEALAIKVHLDVGHFSRHQACELSRTVASYGDRPIFDLPPKRENPWHLIDTFI